MAYINYVSRTDTAITVNLKGLDSSYPNNDRTIYWYIYIDPSDWGVEHPQSLDGGLEQSEWYTFDGLTPGTLYYIACVIKNTAETVNVTLPYITKYTDDAVPQIISFDVTQNSFDASPYTCLCEWEVTDFTAGVTAYEIYVDDYLKASGIVYSSRGSVTIEVYNTGEHTAKIQFQTNEKIGFWHVTFTIAEEELWRLTPENLDYISSSYTKNLTIYPNVIYRYAFKFDYEGTATFYTTGDVDTLGYLTTDASWDSTLGTPATYLKLSDDQGEGQNFEISYDVVPDITYYLWIRGSFGTESGDAVLNIEPPAVSANWISGFYATQQKGKKIVNIEVYLYDWVGVSDRLCKIEARLSGTDEWILMKTFDPASIGMHCNIELNEFATYEVRAKVVYKKDLSWYCYKKATITLYNTALWDWEVGTGSDRDKAYQAITKQGDTTDFSHIVWDDLVDKVASILEAKGRSWDTYYAPYSGTKMNTMPYELTAVMFNSLKRNLDWVYWTNISEVSSGDEVLGSYFITLASCINSAIDTL